jgi:hypothetical protein
MNLVRFFFHYFYIVFLSHFLFFSIFISHSHLSFFRFAAFLEYCGNFVMINYNNLQVEFSMYDDQIDSPCF